MLVPFILANCICDNMSTLNHNDLKVTGALLTWIQNKQEAAGFLVSGFTIPKYSNNFLPDIS